MANLFVSAVSTVASAIGLSIRRHAFEDMEPEFKTLSRRVKSFTMTSIEKLYAFYKSVQHVAENGIAGDIVECGVWKSGSCMLAALALQKFGGAGDRNIYLFDTFEGMPEPTKRDVDYRGRDARPRWEHSQAASHNTWCYSPLESVQANMQSTGFPPERTKFVKGLVEETIPREAPETIAILRLDTDWYESTRHTLVHLYPRLVRGGILILDDYGYWKGAREAADAYFSEKRIQVFLARTDRSGRIAVKP